VVKIDCEEIVPEHIKIGEAAAYLAELKADAFRNLEVMKFTDCRYRCSY
jgi:septum formation protein